MENKIDIKKALYELYKLDWMRRISADRQIDAYRDYLLCLEDDSDDYTFNDYIEEFGYNGELYVSYREFLETEYKDDDYMRSLLDRDNTALIEMYLGY